MNAKINGIDIYYEEFKHNTAVETIILLHGFLSSSFSFRKLIPLLAKDFNVITIDLPPFGKSGKSKHYNYSYENVSKTLLKFIDEYGCKHIYAVGHSMGGQFVLNMMHLRPGLIKKGVLLCSSGYLPRTKVALKVSTYIPFFHSIVKYQLGKTGVLGNLKHVVHDQNIIDGVMVGGYTEPFNDIKIFRALTKMIRHREGDLAPNVLRKIATPCLLIWGEHDRVVPLSTGKRLADDLPRSKIVVLNDAGHLIPEEKPEEVYEEIRKFIALS